ncbi:MAG: HD-GYP domain-containing protein [Gammaproteobacteria bacterium]|nr:HD-GYP domain-containing protein [Gammaproteobacteria bacterium]
MKKKISVIHLAHGMYVMELDRPWTETGFKPPFELQGFNVKNEQEVDAVKAISRYVYIDPTQGADCAFGIEEAQDNSAWSDEDPENLLAADLPPPKYEDQATAEKEREPAREVMRDAGRTFRSLLKRTRAGKSIDTEVVKKAVTKLVESVVRNPDAMMWLLKMKHRDRYSYTHSMTVCVLSLIVGRHLGIPQHELNRLGTAVMLQDVGRTALPEALVTKSGEYSEREFELSKMHVEASVKMLKEKTSAPEEIIEIVRSHHERFDGSGYPRGLEGHQISLLATIAGMVDSYAAMTSNRPYREAMTSFDALMVLYEVRNKQFAAAMVEHFIQCIGIFSIGSFVLLNTDEVAIVVARNRIKQLTPRIMIIIDPEGNRIKPETVDLSTQQLDGDAPIRQIMKVVDPEDYDLDPAEFFV